MYGTLLHKYMALKSKIFVEDYTKDLENIFNEFLVSNNIQKIEKVYFTRVYRPEYDNVQNSIFILYEDYPEEYSKPIPKKLCKVLSCGSMIDEDDETGLCINHQIKPDFPTQDQTWNIKKKDIPKCIKCNSNSYCVCDKPIGTFVSKIDEIEMNPTQIDDSGKRYAFSDEFESIYDTTLTDQQVEEIKKTVDRYIKSNQLGSFWSQSAKLPPKADIFNSEVPSFAEQLFKSCEPVIKNEELRKHLGLTNSFSKEYLPETKYSLQGLCKIVDSLQDQINRDHQINADRYLRHDKIFKEQKREFDKYVFDESKKVRNMVEDARQRMEKVMANEERVNIRQDIHDLKGQVTALEIENNQLHSKIRELIKEPDRISIILDGFQKEIDELKETIKETSKLERVLDSWYIQLIELKDELRSKGVIT